MVEKQKGDRRLQKSSRTYKNLKFAVSHPSGNPRGVFALRERVRGLFLEAALSEGGGGEGILDKLIIILSN